MDFYDNKKGIMLNAFLHNMGSRVTIVKQGFVAITFERKADDQSKMEIKYYIDSEICTGVQIDDDLYIEAEFASLEKDEILEGRDTTKMKLSFYKVSEQEGEIKRRASIVNYLGKKISKKTLRS